MGYSPQSCWLKDNYAGRANDSKVVSGAAPPRKNVPGKNVPCTTVLTTAAPMAGECVRAEDPPSRSRATFR